MYTIKVPKWKDRTIGLSESDMKEEVLEIEITYKDAKGERIWPKKLFIKREEALKCPTYMAKGRFKLRMVPIKDLREYVL